MPLVQDVDPYISEIYPLDSGRLEDILGRLQSVSIDGKNVKLYMRRQGIAVNAWWESEGESLRSQDVAFLVHGESLKHPSGLCLQTAQYENCLGDLVPPQYIVDAIVAAVAEYKLPPETLEFRC